MMLRERERGGGGNDEMFYSVRPEPLFKGGWGEGDAQLIVKFAHHFSSIALYEYTCSQRSGTTYKVPDSYVMMGPS